MTACIEWPGARTRDGYGLVRMPGSPRRRTSASRAAWIEAFGPVPDGLMVCHTCDNPPCVNLDHLWLGTATDNARDRAAKGRSAHNAPTLRGTRNGRAILDAERVHQIIELHEREGRKLVGRPRTGLTRRQIAERFGVSVPTVDAILCGRNWRHLRSARKEVPMVQLQLGRSASSGQGLV